MHARARRCGNGIVFVISADDRLMYILTGSASATLLPDARATEVMPLRPNDVYHFDETDVNRRPLRVSSIPETSSRAFGPNFSPLSLLPPLLLPLAFSPFFSRFLPSSLAPSRHVSPLLPSLSPLLFLFPSRLSPSILSSYIYIYIYIYNICICHTLSHTLTGSLTHSRIPLSLFSVPLLPLELSPHFRSLSDPFSLLFSTLALSPWIKISRR